MKTYEFITLFVSGISLLTSIGVGFYTIFYHHNSLLGKVIRLSMANNFIIHFSFSNLGNRNLLLDNAELVIVDSDEDIPNVLNGLKFPFIIKPKEIQIKSLEFDKEIYYQSIKNKCKWYIVFTVLTLNCKQLYLIVKFDFANFKFFPDYDMKPFALSKKYLFDYAQNIINF